MVPSTLRDKEKLLVWSWLEESEKAQPRHTRNKFRTIVSDELDRLQVEGELRQAIYEYACERADSSAKLAGDTVELGKVDEARRILKDCAARLASAPWRTTVREQWPATIAHEFERLFAEMEGQSLAAGERLEPSPDSALLQLRDAFELLIKFTATVLMRGLIEADREQADWARRQLFKRGLSLGDWANMLREAVKRYRKEISRSTLRRPLPPWSVALRPARSATCATATCPSSRSQAFLPRWCVKDPTKA